MTPPTTILRRLVPALLLGLFAVAGGCDGSGLSPVDDDTGESSDTDASLDDLIGILVTPERVVVPLGSQVQLKATGLLEGRDTLDVTALANWGSSNPAVAEVSDELDQEGVLTGQGTGSTEVFAEVRGIRSPPARVEVSEAELLGLNIRPAQATVEQGDTVQLKAEAAFSDGSRADASSQVLWSTGDPAVATIERGGVLTAVATGSTTVQAEWQGTSSGRVPVEVVEGAEPDLRVASVSAEANDSEVTLAVTVANDGNAGAADFWVDVFVDPASAPTETDLGDYYVPVFYADPGEEVEISYNFEAEPGPHELHVVVDLDDAVAEANEDNNRFVSNIEVGEAEPRPQLKVRSFDWYADETHILYAIDVVNTGTEDSGAFYVDLWYHAESDPTDQPLGDAFWRFEEGVPAGGTEYVDHLVAVDQLDPSLGGCRATPCRSWVTVDTNDEVDETDETDNAAGPIEVVVPTGTGDTGDSGG